MDAMIQESLTDPFYFYTYIYTFYTRHEPTVSLLSTFGQDALRNSYPLVGIPWSQQRRVVATTLRGPIS